jgi:UDP-GlcNAc3NAcA epimerase
MKVLSVIGARPQFIKAAPLSAALRTRHQEILVHTGQHYDERMSAVFFEELGIPAPDHNLGIGGGTHAEQTGAMLPALERVIKDEAPDVVLVYGDTNSTLAASLAAAKLGVPVAHVEAGLRSFQRTMPEEINRVMTDHLSTWLFAPSSSSAAQLRTEGITKGVHVVGDIMYDAVSFHREHAPARGRAIPPGPYVLCTVHRAENTDVEERLRGIMDGIGRLPLPVVLPLHPRTRLALQRAALAVPENCVVTEPASYLEMLALERDSTCVLTDSGGVQKEAYYLGVPCVTLRDETEWTETVQTGWNVLVGSDPERIVAAFESHRGRTGERPLLYGDGRAADSILNALGGNG